MIDEPADRARRGDEASDGGSGRGPQRTRRLLPSDPDCKQFYERLRAGGPSGPLP